MALKPALTLKMGQQLRMTPQLQQAIRLLQLSTLDLELEIQQALDTNPMLEELQPDDPNESDEQTTLDSPENLDDPVNEDSETPIDSESDVNPESDIDPSDIPPDPELDGEAVPDTSQEIDADTISDDLPVDSVWEDIFDEAIPVTNHRNDFEGDDNYFENRNSEATSIHSHLLDQVNLLRLSASDEFIALAILDGLDSNGILTISTQEVLESTPPEWELELDEVEAVLNLIQHLDPIGIASRDVRECLSIQLRSLPVETPWRTEAITVVEQHIAQLANRDYSAISRKTRLKENNLREVLALILSLNPRPGSDIADSNIEYIEPDIYVSKKNNRWVVELNPKSAPRIRVNPEYVSMINPATKSSDKTYLKNNLQEARWFINSLQQRNDTLLRVATKIVEFQRDFLEYGEQAMKPLVLNDIAKAVDLHESTISRVTSQKYMHTPAGVFELKYFFSSHVSTNTGGEVSSTAIRALIKKLVSEENPKKPLSDSKIANMLADQDIKVARRTIAKYRESLLIPPSNERKQLI
ncbi:MAG TPA: RNA polymerase factor sigma-54 [Gammaproteobacteria bacterium]|nr:RNA polymerase factor sigma-54 [Gammaproteobacteria bacterium]